MTVLELHSVTVSFGENVALDDVSLRVEAGELIAVTGRSGSGKSTLLNLAGGMLMPTVGGVVVAGESLGGATAERIADIRRRHVGFVFQNLKLLPRISVAENVALPLELHGTSTKDARSSAIAVLERLGLDDRADDPPSALSGGERQRVAVARALVVGPSLLLGDEPTAALDPTTAEQVMKIIRSACNAGAAGLIVTHDPVQAAWADRVVHLRAGRMGRTSAGTDAIERTDLLK